MARLIKISDDFFVSPEKVSAVKKTGEHQCALFLAGQSAMEGFLLDREADEIVDEINDELTVCDED